MATNTADELRERCPHCLVRVDSPAEWCQHCGKTFDEQPEVEGPVGLGGWLILVGMGLVLGPFFVLGQIATDLLPVFQEGYWPILTDPASDAYHPMWGPLLLFELIGNLVQVTALLVALVLFFQKSSYFPRLHIAIYLGVLAFLILDYWLAGFIPAVAAESDLEAWALIWRQAVSCLIWVPYMLRSKRVRNTFGWPR